MSETAKDYRERGEADLAAADVAILPSAIERHRRSALRWFKLYERRA